MISLDSYDLLQVRRRLPKCVVKALQTKDVKAFVAGGFIRGNVAKEPLSDVDLFVPNEDMANKLVSLIREGQEERFKCSKTENAITLYDLNGILLPIQVITRWYFEEPEALVSSFDFTVCQAAVWWTSTGYDEVNKKSIGTWLSLTSNRFYQDLASKRLKYTSRTPLRDGEAGGSLLRVLKYYRRGYTIPITDMGLVIARLVKGIDLSRYEDPVGTLFGNEERLALVFRGLLREVDPLVDPDHIVKEEGEEEGINGG